MTLSEADIYLALLLLSLAYNLYREIRAARNSARQSDKVDELISLLERASSAVSEEEEREAGEAPWLDLRGNPYTGLWKRLGEEERRADS